jgi:Tfp pilus assembly protein PilN
LNEPVQVIPAPAAADLAARTARRAAANLKADLLPAEYGERYRHQFFDRLWLHGLGYAGVLYAIVLVIYFGAVAIQGYRTDQLEAQVSALSGDYTKAQQLTAQYQILTQRQQLKYAALDCWKQVAEQLPEGINLQRLSFSQGERLSLSGSTPAENIDTLFNFNTAMQKLKVNGQFVFDQNVLDQVAPKNVGGNLQWNFSLMLAHPDAEAETP